jgi:phosphinothricin acetyltransferase
VSGSARRLRPATEADLSAIAAIYNHEVRGGVATFDTVEVSLEERRAWLARHTSPRHPVIVAEDGGDLVGWASLSPWSERCAYARAAEVSIYVAADHQGRGVGGALLGELIERGRVAGLGVLLARIARAGDGGSRRLHERHGFVHIGTMHRVGEKLGRILDVELFELQLEAT